MKFISLLFPLIAQAQISEIGYELVTSSKQCVEECISDPANVYCFYGDSVGGFCCTKDDPHCQHGSYCTAGVKDFTLKQWMCEDNGKQIQVKDEAEIKLSSKKYEIRGSPSSAMEGRPVMLKVSMLSKESKITLIKQKEYSDSNKYTKYEINNHNFSGNFEYNLSAEEQLDGFSILLLLDGEAADIKVWLGDKVVTTEKPRSIKESVLDSWRNLSKP